jgi:hypothetical protein
MLAFLVCRNSLNWDGKIHNLEEQPTPGHKAIVALLIPGQVRDDRVPVRLEDEVRWVRLGARARLPRGVQHALQTSGRSGRVRRVLWS